MDVGINYLSVVVAAVAAFVIGWIWYGPLFGKLWAKEKGMDMAGAGMGYGSLVGEYIAQLVTAYVLAHFIVLLGVMELSAALQLAFWTWLGFYATMLVGPVLWEKGSWTVFAIAAGRALVSLGVMAAILALWQ